MKTTKKNFVTFKKYCEYYQRLFGLNNYQVDYEHVELDDAYASITISHDGHVVGISFATDWDGRELIDKELKTSARHEMCHLLTDKLFWLSSSRHVTESEVKEANEDLVVRLSNILKGK